MPASATMPPTAAPPAGVQIIDTGPPTPPPAPTTQIKVSQMPATATPAPPPPKGSAMDRLRQDLAKRAKSPEGEPPSPKPGTTAAQPAGDTPPDKGTSKGGESAESTAAGSPVAQPGETPAPDDKAKAGKANPWKLVDQYKTKLATVEKENADLKTGALGEQQRKEYQAKIDAATKRAEELENEIKFVDYTKSEEFKKEFVAPYEAAWQRAVRELSEITVTDPQGGDTRAAKPEDLLTLVNMPLGQARELADQYFGKFADDVMAHRKAIRELFDRQNQKLEEVKKTAGEREKTMREQHAAATQALTQTIQENWEKYKGEILKDEKYGKFFVPTEGDDEGNARLAKGFELADKAFTENPLDPKLTPDQRATAIKRHVALRNRAAAFGRLVHNNAKLEAQVAALTKELEEYRTTVPPTGGPTPAGQPAVTGGKVMDQVVAALRAKARPIM